MSYSDQHCLGGMALLLAATVVVAALVSAALIASCLGRSTFRRRLRRGSHLVHAQRGLSFFRQQRDGRRLQQRLFLLLGLAALRGGGKGLFDGFSLDAPPLPSKDVYKVQDLNINAAGGRPLGPCYALAANSKGDVILADTFNHRILRVRNAISLNAKIEKGNHVRKINFQDQSERENARVEGESARIEVLAGGESGGSDGIGTNAEFRYPMSICCREENNAGIGRDVVYICDTQNHRIRRLDTHTKEVTTLTVSESQAMDLSTPINTLSRPLREPQGISCYSPSGVIRISDTGGMAVRELGPNNAAGKCDSKVAPRGIKPSVLLEPRAMSTDAFGRVYLLDVTDSPNGYTSHRILVSRTNGPLPPGFTAFDPLAGSLNPGYRDGLGTTARFGYPQGITALFDGTLLVADTKNNVIRRVEPLLLGEQIQPETRPLYESTTLATESPLSTPTGICCVGEDIWISEADTRRIKRLTPVLPPRGAYRIKCRTVVRAGKSLRSGLICTLEKGTTVRATHREKSIESSLPSRIHIKIPWTAGCVQWVPGMGAETILDSEGADIGAEKATKARVRLAESGWVSATMANGQALVEAIPFEVKSKRTAGGSSRLDSVPDGKDRPNFEASSFIEDSKAKEPRAKYPPRYPSDPPEIMPGYPKEMLIHLPCWMCKMYGHPFTQCTTPELFVSGLTSFQKNMRDGQKLWKWIKAWDTFAELEAFWDRETGLWRCQEMREYLWGPYLHRIPMPYKPINHTAIYIEYGKNISSDPIVPSNFTGPQGERYAGSFADYFSLLERNREWLKPANRLRHNRKVGEEYVRKLKSYDRGFRPVWPFFSKKTGRFNFRVLKREIKEHERFFEVRRLSPQQIHRRAIRLGELERERSMAVNEQRRRVEFEEARSRMTERDNRAKMSPYSYGEEDTYDAPRSGYYKTLEEHAAKLRKKLISRARECGDKQFYCSREDFVDIPPPRLEELSLPPGMQGFDVTPNIRVEKQAEDIGLKNERQGLEDGKFECIDPNVTRVREAEMDIEKAAQRRGGITVSDPDNSARYLHLRQKGLADPNDVFNAAIGDEDGKMDEIGKDPDDIKCTEAKDGYYLHEIGFSKDGYGTTEQQDVGGTDFAQAVKEGK